MRLLRPRASVLLTIIVAACAPATAPARAPVVITGATAPGPLRAADLDTIAEIIRLEDRREFVAARFQAWLRLPHPEVRARAALGAGRIGDRGALPLLERALLDTAAHVRKHAAFALGELGDTTQHAAGLLARLTHQPDSVGVEAVHALTKLGQSYATIETLLTDRAAPAAVRREALAGVWRYPRRPNTLELVLPFAADPDPETRWRALYVLTRGSADPRALPHLLRWLADPDGNVRALAARGLRAPTADSAGSRALALTALKAAVRDPHGHVRINAANALAGYRDQASVAILTPLLTDPDRNVALAAAIALGENGHAEAELAALARAHPHIAVRTAALNGLLRSPAGHAAAFQLARQNVGHADALERLFAARVLASANNPTLLEDIRPLVNDRDGRVASVALNAIASRDTASPPYALFIEKLADPDPGVRAAAVRGLQRRGAPGDLELFLNAYERAQRDTLRYASQAAVDALANLLRQGVPADRSFFLRFRKPADPLLHERVVQRIGAGDWGPTRPLDTRRPIEFYRAAARRFFGADSAAAQPRVRVRTAPGEFVIQLNGREAPLTVLNFISLAERGYFNRGRWHRVVPNFVLQDGDPRGDGSGGPGTVIRDEINRLRYTRGALGMALSGPDTGGSQWFITHSPQPHLDGGYTVFGRVVSGLDVADLVVQDDPIFSIEVIR